MMAKSVPSEDSAPLLPYLIEEMYPCVKQETPMVVFDALKPEVGMTSLVESQFMSMKLQAEKHLPKVELIRLTGGASRNKAIAQIISDIFGAKVECISVSNSAALGAAMRAAHCCGAAPWPQLISDFAQASTCYEPNAERTAIYDVKTRALEVEIQKVVS
jgi:sugar (pentulose or hexulose) kinase